MLDQMLLFVHVIGATVLFGTGAGIAFFMLMAHRTKNPQIIAHVAGTVVIADTVFTATAVVLQPVTGLLLAKANGWDLTESWIATSLLLYLITGLFWLPVVKIQIKLRDIARACAASNTVLTDEYLRLFRIWFACGFPAFFAVIGIFWLMLTKPTLW